MNINFLDSSTYFLEYMPPSNKCLPCLDTRGKVSLNTNKYQVSKRCQVKLRGVASLHVFVYRSVGHGTEVIF